LGRVLDVDGLPIPGLYEAGALGSSFANLFQNGASLAECIVSGRIAGAEAVSRSPSPG
jgi:predicted oxidoreductase